MAVYRSGVIAFGAAPSYLVQVDNVSVDAGINATVNHSGASVHPTFSGTIGVEPSASFESHAIKTALNTIGFVGASIATVTLYFPKLSETAVFAAGSVHRSYTLLKCTCALEEISASHGSEATARFHVWPTYDGANVPIAVNDAGALPAATLTGEKYTLGPIVIDDTAYNIESLTITPGLDVQLFGTNGEIFPRDGVVVSTTPNFQFTTRDLSLVQALGCDDADQPVGKEADDVDLFLRSLTNQGAPGADTDATHIKISVAKCLIKPTDLSAGTTSVATATFAADVIQKDTSTAPFVLTAAAAISVGGEEA